MNLKVIRNLHAYLAVFFFPVALIFAVTGFLFMCGSDGGSDVQVFEVPEELVVVQQGTGRGHGGMGMGKATCAARGGCSAERMAACEKTIKEVLKRNNVPIPAGKGGMKKGYFTLGRRIEPHATLEMSKEGDWEVHMIKPGIVAKLALLHKAKGGIAFRVTGCAFAVLLMSFYCTGLLLLWKNVQLRKRLLVTLLAGFVFAGVMIFLSL